MARSVLFEERWEWRRVNNLYMFVFLMIAVLQAVSCSGTLALLLSSLLVVLNTC